MCKSSIAINKHNKKKMYDLWVKFLKQNKLCEDYHFSDSLLLFDEHAWQWGNEGLRGVFVSIKAWLSSYRKVKLSIN